jgi:hypothetical protein
VCVPGLQRLGTAPVDGRGHHGYRGGPQELDSGTDVNGALGRTFLAWTSALQPWQNSYQGGHTPTRHEPPDARSAALGRDRAEADQARWVELSRPGWLVIWSPWRRMFTAFAYFAPEPVVIDETAVDRLIVAMREAELRYAALRTRTYM